MKVNNKNNNVIITGGTQGLGFSVAEALISNGCKNILLLGRNSEKGLRASEKLNINGVIVFLKNVMFLKLKIVTLHLNTVLKDLA